MSLGVIASGLVFGSLAGLNALGFVLLWRTQSIVNLAQPALGLVGGTVTGLLIASSGWNFWSAALVGLAVGALLAYLSDVLVMRRLRTAPRSAALIGTIGLAAVFGGSSSALPFIVGGPLPTYSLDLGISLYIAPVRLLGPHLLAIGTFVVALVGIRAFLKRTRLGLSALAVGQDLERARALGISPDPVHTLTWVIAGILSTVAGILSIPVMGFSLGGGIAPLTLLLALAPAVFAGMRSLTGAAVAALILGVAYRLMFLASSSAGMADLLLAVALAAAIALYTKRFGRAEAATRSSSWEVAITPRGIDPSDSSSPRIRAIVGVFTLMLLVAAVTPALTLDAGDRVSYAGSAAIALAVVSVAVAWMFTGEVVIGNWGLSGWGAVVASIVPGGWIVRCIAAALAVALLGALLGFATRRRSNLSLPLLSLAAAASAPVLLLAVGSGTVQTDPRVAGAVAAAVAILATAGISLFRASHLGRRMRAARDEPERASWFGADPTLMRMLGLGISSGMAGLAGALYLAAIPAGIAPGAFDPIVSLDILGMAVIGGLGSPVGALMGAAVVQAARHLLPGAWAAIASGLGVVVIVSFFPRGIGGLVHAAWAKLVTWVLRGESGTPTLPVTEREEVMV